ncbi:MAG: glycerol kinase GlpK [Sphingomonadaceae bacterium]|nr:glycerol kinase GlpK [Sphingomonadaceae bacterium]
MAERILLAIDQGTTSTRCMAFGDDGRPRHVEGRELAQHYPQPGWVEHDPEDIWRDTVAVLEQVAEAAGGAPAAIGLANQRETVVLWDRATGTPLYKAIVWQDRRTAPLCARLKADRCEAMVRARTGLLLDPYFSGTKLAWLLDHVADARERAARGGLAFGTIDSFLLWRLTGGRVHATDATNASRTLLFNIHSGDWDDDLLTLLNIPRALLPEIRDTSGIFGETRLGGRPVPIGGMAGDQQAALVGQACFRPGEAKSTYGTGCFLLLNTGDEPVASSNGMLTTVAYRLGGKTTYALEGAIFVAGAAVKWLRDGLGIIKHAAETESLAADLADNGGVYMVPAFVGLGAPHWQPDARAAISGLTFDAGRAHIARAALESVAYQTADLLDAMREDGAGAAQRIRIDGGMAANGWFCQFLADIAGARIERPASIESTAAGAAFLAGMAAGVWDGPDALSTVWQADGAFAPDMPPNLRTSLRQGWDAALARSR